MAIELDESEEAKRAPKVGGKNEMPKTPDFSAWQSTPKRQSPFLLDDFRGSNVYKKVS